MTIIEQIERQLSLKLSHNEVIEKQIFGLFASEQSPTAFKSSTLVSASNERIYISTLVNEQFFCEEIHYATINAVYHRKRILSGLETIILTPNKRLSISHIEDGCPIELMLFIKSKMDNPFSTTA